MFIYIPLPHPPAAVTPVISSVTARAFAATAILSLRAALLELFFLGFLTF
jgi:hypothetical protein